MRVARGETLTFTASGEVQYGGGGGSVVRARRLERSQQRQPAAERRPGALIGRIGTGAPFAVNSGTRIQAPVAGQLFLGVNDTTVADNQGEYQVEIERSSRRR